MLSAPTKPTLLYTAALFSLEQEGCNQGGGIQYVHGEAHRAEHGTIWL
jgi:hypothetical protein